jgi:hypothetical protein
LVQGQRVHGRGLAEKNREIQAIRITPKTCLLFDKAPYEASSPCAVRHNTLLNQLVHGT